ncbi:MAG: ABC transporter permease, partial [Xanthomonadales bacterium]|nr:ABC transporter permease [Xanthomonadales bacterium]
GGRRDLLGRMAIRQLMHRPWKTLLTLVGIAMASAILTLGMFQRDALFYMVDRQFALAQRNDLQVTFAEQQHPRVLDELRALPGVARVEGVRYEPVRLQQGSQRKRMSLEGWPADSELKRLLVGGERMIGLPPSGLVLTAALAERLQLRVGDRVYAQRLEGDRRELLLPIAGLVDEPIGSSAYADSDWLDRVLGDGPRVSGAAIALLPDAEVEALYRELQERPQIIAISQRRAAIDNFYDTMAESLDMFTSVASILAAVIAFGVLYNTVRIAYAERERELATLRVLGFQHQEVSALLIVELSLLTVLAMPLGVIAGWALTQILAQGLRSELYRVPAYLSPATLSSSAIVVLVAALAAALAIRHKVARLAPLAALGSRE